MKYMVAELLHTASKAWYEDGKICIEMTDGSEFRFPVHLNKRLANATQEQRSVIEVTCGGTGLHWPEIDEDLSVIGIIEGRYGH